MSVKDDYQAYGLTVFKMVTGIFGLHTFWLVCIYRLAHWLYKQKVPFIPWVLRAAGIFFYGADIAPNATIGPGFRIAHSVGIVIGGDVVAGKNLELFSNVTIGGREITLKNMKMPALGDNVSVFTNATVLGPIIIGDNVSIGANSVVIKDVAANVSVAGNPAKVIGKIEKAHSLKSMGR